jgi:epoxide hydrolase 4
MDNRSHHTIELSGTRLHFVSEGDGPTILLLHGFPATWYTWNGVMSFLSRDFRVVCPDMRGYNLSGRPSGVSEYSAEKIAGDIVELLDLLGESRVSIVGHDWGGAIAYRLAAFYPERVSQLAVLNCPHPVALVHHMRSNFRQLRRSWYILFFQLPWLPEFLIRRDIDGFIRAAFRPLAAFSSKELAHYREALLVPGALTAALNYYRASGRAVFGRPTKWPKIECPTLLIWGEKDQALGLELTDDMERYFSGRLDKEFLPEAGHWVHSQEPEIVISLLADFLERESSHTL